MVTITEKIEYFGFEINELTDEEIKEKVDDYDIFHQWGETWTASRHGARKW